MMAKQRIAAISAKVRKEDVSDTDETPQHDCLSDSKDHHHVPSSSILSNYFMPRSKLHKGLLLILGVVASILLFMKSSSDNGQEMLEKNSSAGSPRKVSNLDKDSNNNCQWRPEPLVGVCDTTKATPESQKYKTAQECENACCRATTCVSFQFRTKEGCLWANRDTRIGAEKDGVSGWCEPRPPAQWQGQRTKVKGSNEAIPDACRDDEAWNPHELSGQCFGLGARKRIDTNTPRACQQACCAKEDCAIWQWREDAGCFYHKRGFNCQEANPLDFEAFVGKRKVQPGRTYKPYAYSGDYADLAGSENLQQ